ncbi:venom serine protease-like isoform X3 [Phymastichus coffea]|nr:venom serine protease-like isoform X3 [Phymastichus coffea]
MTNEVYCCLQILGFLFHFSIAEPIRGDNVVMANEGEFPFVAALIKKTNCSNVERGLICTGVLISERLVLTAAHCFEKVSLDDMQIVLGSVDLRHGVRYDVSKRITYNEWAEIEGVHKAIIKNDIAVIKLSEKVHKNVSISAEFSYKKRSKLENRNVTMLGWGHTSLSSNRTVRYLRKTILTVLTSEECQQKIHELINETVHVEDSVFCTKAEPFATSG